MNLFKDDKLQKYKKKMIKIPIRILLINKIHKQVINKIYLQINHYHRAHIKI